MKKKSDTLVLRSYISQRARQLKNEKSLSQSKAYDEATKELGYSNYKNYLNSLEAKTNNKHKENLLSDISKKIQFEIPFDQSSQMSFQDKVEFLKIFQHPDDIQAQCNKWNLMKDEIQSVLFNEFLSEEGRYEINFRHKYFIAKEISLSDLQYEMKGDMLYVDGDYDLRIKFDFDGFCVLENAEQIEFGFETSDCYKEYPHFKDRELAGSFRIKIDRNTKITIPHLNIIEIIDGIVYAGTLKPTARLIPAFRPELACVSL